MEHSFSFLYCPEGKAWGERFVEEKILSFGAVPLIFKVQS